MLSEVQLSSAEPDRAVEMGGEDVKRNNLLPRLWKVSVMSQDHLS